MIFGKKQSRASARVVDSKLILSFPHASTPVVWQMDLTEAKNSAYEIREVNEDKTIVMTSRQQSSQKTDVIASFHNREDAVEALMATSAALENAHGHIAKISSASTQNANIPAQPAPQPANINKPVSWGKWAAVFAGIGLIALLFSMVQSLSPRTPSSVQSAQMAGSFGSEPTNASESAGVPVSADDFLMQR